MGWASGTGVCIDVWQVVRKYVPDRMKARVLAKVIKALQEQDWDCEGEIADAWPESERALELALGKGWRD